MTTPENCSALAVELRRFQEKMQNENNEAGDATWILTSAFIIFTMQSGFGLLEAGSVSAINECNIMVKNAVDVVFGALGYWICGYAFSFGQDKAHSNGFTGYGNFVLNHDEGKDLGKLYAHYFFQLSFATTATTIVSGAMAERTNLRAYMLFSFLNFLSYVFPAHWIWDNKGFLKRLGAVDVAGCGPVHIVGGMSAVIATLMLKPRHKVFDKNASVRALASPTNVVLGTFMLWWGWLGFNCGSTFGVSAGKWKLATRAAVTTVNGSVGGGLWSIFYCYRLTNKFRGKLNVSEFTSGILGGLVSTTAICAICRPWEALLIGFIGGIICSFGRRFLNYIEVDDPVGCIPVHCFCGIWGSLAVGLFGQEEKLEAFSKYNGVFNGGPVKFLGYQALSVVCFTCWSAVTSAIELFIADKIFGLRLNLRDELAGSDIVEHGIQEPISSRRKSGLFFTARRKPERRAGLDETRRSEAFTITHDDYRDHKGKVNFGYLSVNKTNVEITRGSTVIESRLRRNAKRSRSLPAKIIDNFN